MQWKVQNIFLHYWVILGAIDVATLEVDGQNQLGECQYHHGMQLGLQAGHNLEDCITLKPQYKGGEAW